MIVKRMSVALPFAAAAASVAPAGLAAGLVADLWAETSDIAPMVPPYRIDVAPWGGREMPRLKVSREFQRWITTCNWSRCWMAS
jgi:hypothetical protein